MMKLLGEKPNGERMTEKETAISCLQCIQKEVERLNPSKGLRNEIELLVGIVKETDNKEAKKIMRHIVKEYKRLLLDIEQSFVAVKHRMDMCLIDVEVGGEEQDKAKRKR